MKYKLIKILALIFLTLFLSPKKILANENFLINVISEYTFDKDGNSHIEDKVTLVNKKTEIYAKEFIYEIIKLKPVNISVKRDNKSLNFLINQDDFGSKIKIIFDQPILGKDKSQTFNIDYEIPNFVFNQGTIWEISIPKLTNALEFENYDLILKVPNSYGSEAYITPKPKSFQEDKDYRIYKFDKKQILSGAINLAFGEFQVFSFKISYHLTNDSFKFSQKEIAIPPDTNLQKVYYQKISPQPINVRVDEDGNWLALYKLQPKEKLKIDIEGKVQIFSNPFRNLLPNPSSLLANLRPTEFWQSDNQTIIAISKNLETVRDIYNYVITNLRYNHQGINSKTKRLGAVEALKNPNEALCTEFTDLFIALARAKGIPAREINGYAYTENQKMKPLSLFSDVLHSWPEYWDSDKNLWIEVDPTWGQTSGIDYFDKMDLRHFSFVIHGKDSSQPLSPGFYKEGDNSQKDIFISISELPENYQSRIDLQIKKRGILNLFKQNLIIDIKNNSSFAEYDLNPRINFDSQEIPIAHIKSLPPFSHYQTEISLATGILARESPQKVVLNLNDMEFIYFVNKRDLILKQITIFSLCIILFLILIYRKFYHPLFKNDKSKDKKVQ